MNKKGFTLAEVLVTLGIVGVVAALTTPALIQNVGDAKVAPRLQKAKATFETAVEMMLNEQDANTIMSVANDGKEFGKILSNYMKISYNSTTYPFNCTAYHSNQRPTNDNVEDSSEYYERFDSDDGVIFLFPKIIEKDTVLTSLYSVTPNNQKSDILQSI